MPAMFESICVSQLCSKVSPTELGNIIRVSRLNNAAGHLTGVMLFDGERFCHFLEGMESAVRRTVARIAVDPRHVGFTPLHEGSAGNGRRFDAWHVGILAPDGPSPLLAFATTRGVEAVAVLLHMFHEKQSHGIHVV